MHFQWILILWSSECCGRVSRKIAMKHGGEFWFKFCKNIWLEKYVYSDSVITVGAKIRNLARLVPPPELATGCCKPLQSKLRQGFRNIPIQKCTRWVGACFTWVLSNVSQFVIKYELWIAPFARVHYLLKGEHNSRPNIFAPEALLLYVWYNAINCSNFASLQSQKNTIRDGGSTGP